MDLGSGKKAECTAQNKGKREEMRCNGGNNPARTKWLCYKQKPRDMFKIQHRGSSVCQEDVSYIYVILVLFRRNLSFLYDYHFSQTDLATCHIFFPLWFCLYHFPMRMPSPKYWHLLLKISTKIFCLL